MEKITEKFGFKTYEFEVMGRYARLICPSIEPNGKWLLKTEYADAFPATSYDHSPSSPL